MRRALIAAVLIPTLLSTSALDAQSRPATPAGPPLALSFKAYDGSKFNIDSQRGKIVVVVVIKPGYTDALRTVKSEASAIGGVSAVAVCVGTGKDEIARSLTDTDFSYPVLYDEKTGAAPLAKKLGVTAFPWCILVDPDGHVAGQFPLSLLHDRLQQQVKLTPPLSASRAVLSLGNEKLTLAESMLAAENYWAAARYLSQLPDDAKQDTTIGERLSAATLLLDRAAPSLISDSEKLINDGKLGEAVFRLEQLDKALKDSPVFAKIEDQLHSVTDDPDLKAKAEKQRPAVAAADLLDQAHDYDAKVGRAKAYALLDQAVKKYPGTPAAEQAKALLAQWETNPADRRKLRDALYGDKAEALLSRADTLANSSFREKSKALYEQVVRDYPYTTAAEKAAEILKAWK
jgi:hypothetical protein